MSFKFLINDLVLILVGKYKGKVGKIKKFSSDRKKVIVEGINLIYKHQKSVPSQKIIGGIFRKEAFIDISNISHYCNKSYVKQKVGFKFENKKKIRFFKKKS